MKIYFSNELPKSLSLTNDDFVLPRKEMEIVDDSAIIHVTGLLESKAPAIFEKLGFGTTYETLVKEIQTIPENINEVVFVFDSPGGNVIHLKETAQLIKELGEHVSTVAYIDSICASAALYLASACNAVIASPSALIGAVGTLCVIDDSDDGQNKVIVSKGADFKVRTEDNKEQYDQYLQERVDNLAAEFKSWLKENRNLTNEEEAFSGKMFSVEEAINLGLVDEIVPFTKLNY